MLIFSTCIIFSEWLCFLTLHQFQLLQHAFSPDKNEQNLRSIQRMGEINTHVRSCSSEFPCLMLQFLSTFSAVLNYYLYVVSPNKYEKNLFKERGRFMIMCPVLLVRFPMLQFLSSFAAVYHSTFNSVPSVAIHNAPHLDHLNSCPPLFVASILYTFFI